MIKWGGEPGDRIMVHRQWVPLWLAHLVQQTPFEWVAYTELK
jgi:hypothetical protein